MLKPLYVCELIIIANFDRAIKDYKHRDCCNKIKIVSRVLLVS